MQGSSRAVGSAFSSGFKTCLAHVVPPLWGTERGAREAKGTKTSGNSGTC